MVRWSGCSVAEFLSVLWRTRVASVAGVHRHTPGHMFIQVGLVRTDAVAGWTCEPFQIADYMPCFDCAIGPFGVGVMVVSP
jgi:hypothetical protein